MNTDPLFDDITLETIPDKSEFRKGDLMPLTGWPDGIDPYPDSRMEEVVLTVVYGYEYKFSARQVGGIILRFGQPFTFNRIKLHVTELTIESEFRNGGYTINVKAIGRSRSDDGGGAAREPLPIPPRAMEPLTV